MSNHPSRSYVYLLVILTAATMITLISTFLNYRGALRTAKDSLELEALGIAVSLEASLSRITADSENIFKNIITEGRWEGIAFIALYDKENTTILHSNEQLIGKRIQDEMITEVAQTGRSVHDYVLLGTGEKVFVLYFPVHLRQGENILKVALHTYPASKIIRQAGVQAFSVVLLTSILWITGFFFARAMKRSENLEKAIAEKERMAVLGEMAATLAHEIRNPIGSIKGFAQYLLEQKCGQEREETNPLKEYLDIIVVEAKRLETLTENLLIYARPANINTSEFDLRELIDETVRAFALSAGEDSSVRLQTLAPGGIRLFSDRDKLKQILLNIIQNSLDAMSLADRPRASRMDRDEKVPGFIEITAENDGADKISIIVRDNGPGMNKETMAHAFQPFFTTKTKGSGLGLAIVDRLSKTLGGNVEVESFIGKGTAFRIAIPKKTAVKEAD